MKIPLHISLDIETFSVRTNAVIASVGIALVNAELTGVEESFELFLDIQEQLDNGAVIDGSTLNWWLMQGHKSEFTFQQIEPVDKALKDISAKIESWRLVRKASITGISEIEVVPLIWSFDGVIMRELYTRHKIQPAWEFWQERCLRTILCTFNDHTAKPPDIPKIDPAKAHRALYDATYQAELLMWCFKQDKKVALPEIAAVNKMLLKQLEKMSMENRAIEHFVCEGFVNGTTLYQCKKCLDHITVQHGHLITDTHWHEEWNDGSEPTRGYINQG